MLDLSPKWQFSTLQNTCILELGPFLLIASDPKNKKKKFLMEQWQIFCLKQRRSPNLSVMFSYSNHCYCSS